jgi:collagenase-like PrtC family protease
VLLLTPTTHARSAANFSADELPEVMSYLRARGVKGYVALNVLVGGWLGGRSLSTSATVGDG